MIRPDGFAGAAFTTAADGDLRSDAAARSRVAAALGLGADWATVRQVHGDRAVTVDGPGDAGSGDALVSRAARLPLAVFTADCAPIVLEADGVAAAVHAGWRGAASGILPAALLAMERAGAPARRAAIGPAIGPCCFEVGPEVAARFPGFVTRTTWGTTSVDLPGHLVASLQGLEVWASEDCTRCGDGYFSHRADATPARQAGIAWVP
jgi:polyphenol oxidase